MSCPCRIQSCPLKSSFQPVCPPKPCNVAIPRPGCSPYAICDALYPCAGNCVPVNPCEMTCQPFPTPGSKHAPRCDNENSRNIKFPQICVPKFARKMCKTPCNDPRCALYDGPVKHGSVCNPSSARVAVKYIECCNREVQRQVNNIVTGPIHVRTFNFCPPRMTEAELGLYDTPQNPVLF